MRLKSVYDSYLKLLSEKQLLYDEETNHSINNSEQDKWDGKIEAELDSLRKYKKK